jgi:uncharacterized protein involved in type VI secretion and phage assembly
VPGLITALVTNTSDPDRLGRVKVKFPWLTPSGQEGESNWARVAFGAWNAPGVMLIPEVDDEVLVAFIGGDPRAPVIIGGLYNGVDRPPANNN